MSSNIKPKERMVSETNMKLISIVLILMLSFFLGCVQTPVETPTPTTKGLAFETIKTSALGFGSRQNYVITNSSEWANLWNKLKPNEKLPTVDFKKDMVFAVFMGGHTTGGFNIVITKIVETEKTVEVFVREVSPGRSCIVTQATTAPYHIVKVQKVDKDVVFNVTQEVMNCP